MRSMNLQFYFVIILFFIFWKVYTGLVLFISKVFDRIYCWRHLCMQFSLGMILNYNFSDFNKNLFKISVSFFRFANLWFSNLWNLCYQRYRHNSMCALVTHLVQLTRSWMIAHQATLLMEFSRQEHWSRLSFLSPGDLPNAGIEPKTPALQMVSLSSLSLFMCVGFEVIFSLHFWTAILCLFFLISLLRGLSISEPETVVVFEVELLGHLKI